MEDLSFKTSQERELGPMTPHQREDQPEQQGLLAPGLTIRFPKQFVKLGTSGICIGKILTLVGFYFICKLDLK